jgi:hypothetical protein
MHTCSSCALIIDTLQYFDWMALALLGCPFTGNRTCEFSSCKPLPQALQPAALPSTDPLTSNSLKVPSNCVMLSDGILRDVGHLSPPILVCWSLRNIASYFLLPS